MWPYLDTLQICNLCCSCVCYAMLQIFVVHKVERGVSEPPPSYYAHSIFFTLSLSLVPDIWFLPRSIHVCSWPLRTMQQIKSPLAPSASLHAISLRTTSVLVPTANLAGFWPRSLSMMRAHSFRSSSVRRAPLNRSLLCRLRFMSRRKRICL